MAVVPWCHDDALQLRVISQGLQLMIVVGSGLGVRVRLSLLRLGVWCSGVGDSGTSSSASEGLLPLTQA